MGWLLPHDYLPVLKPIYAHLRSLGHFCLGHFNDSFLMGCTYTSCEENILKTTNTFLKLGFVINLFVEELSYFKVYDFFVPRWKK